MSSFSIKAIRAYGASLSNYCSLGIKPLEERSGWALWYDNKIWYHVRLGIGSTCIYVLLKLYGISKTLLLEAD